MFFFNCILVFADNDFFHYHIEPSLQGRSSFFPVETKLEALSNSKSGIRVRRYVPDPIAQLADNYQKAKFLVSPNTDSLPPKPADDNRKLSKFCINAHTMFTSTLA